MTLFGCLLLAPDFAFASEGGKTVIEGLSVGLIGLAAAAAIGLAAVAGTTGQARVISAALEAIGRNPGAAGKVFLPMIIGLAFVESLVIFSFVIAYSLGGKF